MTSNGDEGMSKDTGHGSKRKGKRRRGNDLESTELKIKVPKVRPVVSLGQNSTVTERYSNYLTSLANFFPSEKSKLKVTDKKELVIRDVSATHGLYLEWSKEDNAYFLWASDQENSLAIKFELLAVSEPDSKDVKSIVTKRPLLAFSKGFDIGDNWMNVKTVLCQLFVQKYAPVKGDCLCSFTRFNGKFQLQFYEIHITKDSPVMFVPVEPYFILKPLEITQAGNVVPFIDEDKFLVTQRCNSLSLEPAWLDSSCLGIIQDMEENLNSSMMLHDLSEFEGFNTTADEYFQRYHAFRMCKVHGTGNDPVPFPFSGTPPLPFIPEVISVWICLPFKVFARSLIVCVGDAFKMKACFEKIKRKNIFIRRNTVAILGVRLIKYTPEKANENLKDVGHILKHQLRVLGLRKTQFPEDLRDALLLLDTNPLDNYELFKNNVCWMDSQEKVHMMDDLHQDFKYRMGDYDQLQVGMGFSPFNVWVQSFRQNWLLDTCRKHNLPKKDSPKELEDWIERKRLALLPNLNNKYTDACNLYSVREYFASVNNAMKHLVQTALELKRKLQLTHDDVDHAVSSVCVAVIIRVQKAVPLIFRDPVRSSYARFSRYFPPADGIRFKPEDQK